MDNSILVSCIMPTRGRPELARLAVECWQAQTYPNRDLLILDDADDLSFPDGFNESGIAYMRTDGTIHYNIPQKLNMLCEAARGEVICRFDDDDWSAPTRIEDQLWRLAESGKSVTGYHSMVFIDENHNCRKYENDGSYALGTSLMFRKSWWAENPFKENKPVGSDNWFVRAAREARELISVDAGELMFARAHDSNTNEKRMDKYSRVSDEDCAFATAVDALVSAQHA